MILDSFEHKFLRTHQRYFSKKDSSSLKRHFFLGISGGVDSMVLLELFNKFKNQMKCEFRVCYVHHGVGLDKDRLQNDFRAQSLDLVKAYCETHNLEFVTNEDMPSTELKDESSLRQWRYKHFESLKKDFEILVLAHHLDDLLETQLMDLIRGCHFETWSNYREYNKRLFRPLSQVNKDEIYQYAQSKKLNWIEDPSNSESDHLRNWLRNGFLTELSQKSVTFKTNLMKNLLKLYEFQPTSDTTPVLEVSITEWMLMTDAEKKQFILKSALKLGLKSMTQGQLSDIVKKLDLGQKDITFQTGPIFWTKTTDRLKACSLNAYREIT